MSISDLRLSLMSFPQSWDGKSRLDFNVVVVPVGDPLAPLTPTGPPFARTQLSLEAVFIPSLDSLPSPTAAGLATFRIATPLPPNQLDLFGTFLGMYPIDPAPVRRPIGPDLLVRKDLPPSYLRTAGINAPRTPGTTAGDEFGCSLLGQDPGPTPRGSILPRSISWGAILSFALRQPRLARELGLVYPVTISMTPAAVKDGGWIYVVIDSTNPDAPYARDATSTPPLVRSYAARIPPLSTARPLFAAVLFPVMTVVTDPKAYDQGQLEAELYDDGFAAVAHCDQPTTGDAASGHASSLTPATDAGIQIGWDDEQVTAWHNRQLDIARAAGGERSESGDPARRSGIPGGRTIRR